MLSQNNTTVSKQKEQQDVVKKHILVAEDDKFYANIYRKKLTAEGYDVQIAENGEIALELARKQKPDLILLDLVMPIKDGFSVLKDLKADPNLKDVKVLVLSNLGQDEDVNKAVGLGAADYLVKTNLSIQEMMDKVKEYL
jgi:DNA-binding response OmpR family regulator